MIANAMGPDKIFLWKNLFRVDTFWNVLEDNTRNGFLEIQYLIPKEKNYVWSSGIEPSNAARTALQYWLIRIFRVVQYDKEMFGSLLEQVVLRCAGVGDGRVRVTVLEHVHSTCPTCRRVPSRFPPLPTSRTRTTDARTTGTRTTGTRRTGKTTTVTRRTGTLTTGTRSKRSTFIGEFSRER